MPGLQNYLDNFTNELDRAHSLHPAAFRSPHEGYAVLLEELDEAWDAIKADDLKSARSEMISVGAMALRFLLDTENLV